MTQTPLTRTMQPIIEAIGFDAAAALVRAFGGREVYLAETPRPGTDVVVCIGLAKAQQLVACIGAGKLDVPRCLGWLAALRRERVVIGREAGATIADLASGHGYTERHIRNILRDAEAEGLMPAPF